MRVLISAAALDNPHRGNPDPHWRLYLDGSARPVAIQAQDFDYFDYTDNRFLTEDSYPSEQEAWSALNDLTSQRLLDPDFSSSAVIGRILTARNLPISRQQAVDAYLADLGVPLTG
jgi:hypothetical protein